MTLLLAVIGVIFAGAIVAGIYGNRDDNRPGGDGEDER